MLARAFRPRSPVSIAAESGEGETGKLTSFLKPTFGCEVHANEEEEEEEAMKQPPASSYLYHQKQQQDEEIEEAVGVTIGMEVDDAEPIDILPDFDRQQPPVDADFFNSFEDDFDDQDIA